MDQLPSITTNPAVPEDEVWLVTPTHIAKAVNVGKQKAIEPDAIQTPSRKPDWTRQMQTNEGWFEKYQPSPSNPSPLMMRLGYTRNPELCSHTKKRMMLGSTTWRCTDCGEEM